jgi:peptide/nickel transport system permease protein
MKLFGHPLNLGAWVGLMIIGAYVLVIAVGPSIALHGEADLVGEPWAPPSATAWLGLDHLGRDMFSRLVIGGRTTVGLALIITLLAFVLGVTLAFAAATLHPWVDLLLARAIDALMAMPSLVMALVVLSVLGTSIPVLIVTIAVIESTRIFRVARAVAMNIVTLDYVDVARLRAEGLLWVIRREILPNALPPLVAEFGLRVCYTLLFVASLSFLGLGIQPPAADWGSMVKENAAAINYGSLAPLIPAAAIAILTVGINLVIDWFLSIHGRSVGTDQL